VLLKDEEKKEKRKGSMSGLKGGLTQPTLNTSSPPNPIKLCPKAEFFLHKHFKMAK
jgi:hypothetical protein